MRYFVRSHDDDEKGKDDVADAEDVACVLMQAEEVQHQLGDKFDRLSETAKNGML